MFTPAELAAAVDEPDDLSARNCRSETSIPILDLSRADDPKQRQALLDQLHDALFNVGFLYLTNHSVPKSTISNLTDLLPQLFSLPSESKARMSKLNSPHFLGYSGFAEETTLGKRDLREQFDFATELPVVYRDGDGTEDSRRDFSKLYWRLRGPNQWPSEAELPGFREAFTQYAQGDSGRYNRCTHHRPDTTTRSPTSRIGSFTS
jgi:isopenicillin N synthase-like dioxygenase